ncbi:hypothetical protein THTE_1348 [Thermogutta terrifontis]|uniref:Uncharacterized protein n=1 Tax=Thermogutta terrifontis TaxID=1331910 RepID=A0A286RDA9_9BACT|nr:hypothetical protein THTE_1348 [Thermogutta terrifontis]
MTIRGLPAKKLHGIPNAPKLHGKNGEALGGFPIGGPVPWRREIPVERLTTAILTVTINGGTGMDGTCIGTA